MREGKQAKIIIVIKLTAKDTHMSQRFSRMKGRMTFESRSTKGAAIPTVIAS